MVPVAAVTALSWLPVAAPALPLDEAGKYVAGAYVVFLVLIVVYVAIMAAKLQRIERELGELAGFAETRANGGPTAGDSETRPISVPSGPSSVSSGASEGGGGGA